MAAFGESYGNAVITCIGKPDREVLHMEEAGRIRIALPVCRETTQGASEICLHVGSAAMEELHREESHRIHIVLLCYQQATRKNIRSDD